MARKYVVVTNTHGCGAFCDGIYDDYCEALGHAMNDIFQFKENYKDDGDTFTFTDPELMEGDGGECITVTFNSKNASKEQVRDVMILYHDTAEGK